jgi:hypothetical protein
MISPMIKNNYSSMNVHLSFLPSSVTFHTNRAMLPNQLNFHFAHMPSVFIGVYFSDGADHVQALLQKAGNVAVIASGNITYHSAFVV